MQLATKINLTINQDFSGQGSLVFLLDGVSTVLLRSLATAMLFDMQLNMLTLFESAMNSYASSMK